MEEFICSLSHAVIKAGFLGEGKTVTQYKHTVEFLHCSAQLKFSSYYTLLTAVELLRDSGRNQEAPRAVAN